MTPVPYGTFAACEPPLLGNIVKHITYTHIYAGDVQYCGSRCVLRNVVRAVTAYTSIATASTSAQQPVAKLKITKNPYHELVGIEPCALDSKVHSIDVSYHYVTITANTLDRHKSPSKQVLYMALFYLTHIINNVNSVVHGLLVLCFFSTFTANGTEQKEEAQKDACRHTPPTS